MYETTEGGDKNMYSLSDIMWYCQNDYTVVDLETTGLSRERDEIIELSYVRVRNDMIVDKHSQFIRTKNFIPNRVTQLTGITNADLTGQPTIEKVMPEFCNYIGNDVLVGHNFTFDLGFLNAELKRLQKGRLCNMTVDTMNMAKTLVKCKSYKLQDLRKYFGIPENHAHRAIDDCITTIYVYQKLKEIACEKEKKKPESEREECFWYHMAEFK